ncbi:MAG: hypothetical protein N4A64_07855 [Marinisporobacter sp.]|jgi:hypothetical protein|nr:hypothetical protein [Marinisporobacter sp.]
MLGLKIYVKLMVLESVFNELLEEETEHVFHYSVAYWAKEVRNEYLSEAKQLYT